MTIDDPSLDGDLEEDELWAAVEAAKMTDDASDPYEALYQADQAGPDESRWPVR